MVDFIEEMNWGFHEEDAEFRRIPEDEKLISQYLLIYDGTDLYDAVDWDFQTARVSLNLNVHSANNIDAVINEIRTYLQANISGINWEVAGVGRMFADMEELLVKGQVSSLGGALLLIFILMLILWRSFWQSLLCMLPNLSPIFLIFICMGLFGIWLDMATAMIASVAVGIAVDDTIHIFHGFIKRMKQGVKPATALLRTTSHAGRAVMTTTIILASQFLILLSSQFIPTSNFGMLTSIGLITALLFDLMVLPALLIVIYRKRQKASAPVPAD
jgi:predicted RND superfamily exporter protein